MTSPERTNNLPDVPTTRELGLPEIDSHLWYSYAAPAGTPAAVVSRLAELIRKAVETPTFKDRFQPLSFQWDVRVGDDLTRFLANEADRWKTVIVENNIRFTD